MHVRNYLLLLFLINYIVLANAQDSTGIQYVVDTIAAPNCYQSEDGAILLDNVSIPGTIDRYEWSDGSEMEDLIYVNGGYYQLTVYNTDGESFQTEEFFIPEPDSLEILPFISAPTSEELNNGFIDFTIRGGTSPYDLAMIYNQDTILERTDSLYTLEQVDTGFYIIAVLDARGCTDTVRFDIGARPCEMLVVAIVEPAECDVSPTGSIELIVENAVEPYTIDWEDQIDNRPTAFNLDAGKYHFAVRDRRRCMAVDSIEIVYEDRIPPEVVARRRLVLYLDENGKKEIFPEDLLVGAKDKCHNNLTFRFDKNTFDCRDVGNNEINFLVIDGAGNSTSLPIEVEIRDTQSVELIYQDTVYTALCNGIAQYPAPQVLGSCATPTSGGIVKETEREITSAGTYVDRYYFVRTPGDTLKAEVTVIVSNTRVQSFLIVEEPQCNTGDDGSVAVALRNSMSPVTYLWDDGSSEDYIFGLQNQKEYNVTVTEGSGCVFQLSAFIEGPDSLKVGLNDIIENEATIDIIPAISGGNEPLKYAWYSGGVVVSESPNLLNTPDGKRYQLIVTDARGCQSIPLIVDRLMSPADPGLENTVDVFPNPATGSTVHVRFRDDVSSYSHIRMFNTRQQMILERTPLNTEMTIDLSSYPPGIYFMQIVRSDGLFVTKKLIRQ